MIHLKKYFKNIWNIQKNIFNFAPQIILKTKDATLPVTY